MKIYNKIILVFALFFIVSGANAALEYKSLILTRIDNDLYKTQEGMIIQTQLCLAIAPENIGDLLIYRYGGILQGKLKFATGEICDVVGLQ